jgi:hypothetical protein
MRMKLSSFLTRWYLPAAALAAVVLAIGPTPLLARPEPPAAERLMDPTKPENKNAGHLFFRSDDGTLTPVAPAPPTASEQAFKSFKKGPATFEEFCKQNPLTGKPLGQARMTIEVLATTADASIPAEPTAAMLSEGTLLRQRVFGNSQAQTENVLPIDRQGDGSKLPEPAWEGERLFTCLEQTDAGYTLTFTFAESRVVSWSNTPAQPVLEQREVNEKVSLSPDGKWVVVGSGPSGLLYVRLVKN